MAGTCGAGVWCSHRLFRFAAAGLALAMLGPAPAMAHTGERGQVLLLPTKLYIIGGALAAALSFAALAFGSKKGSCRRRTRTLRLGAIPQWMPFLTSTMSFACAGVLVLAGLFGYPDPLSNPLPATFWTLWWVGFTALTAVAGNLWKLLNPWLGPYSLFMRNRESSPPLAWPEWLGCLPALLLFLCFAWFELVYPTPQDPLRLATAIIIYSLMMFSGLLLFGPAWLDRGDAFTVFFSMVSRLSPAKWIAQKEDRSIRVALELGWPGTWLTEGKALSSTGIAFVLLALSTVSFDGLSRTFAWTGWRGLNPLEFPGRSALLLPNTFGLLLSFVALAAAYGTALTLGRSLQGFTTSDRSRPGLYVLSIVPIAISRRAALLGEAPMIVLMIGYTVYGLWLLSTPVIG